MLWALGGVMVALVLGMGVVMTIWDARSGRQ